MTSGSRWRLDGARTVIAGGTKGIGWACAAELLELGASVLSVGRDADGVERVRRAWQADGLDGDGRVADAATDEGRQRLAEAVQMRWGALDILVNNVGAGFASRSPNIRIRTLSIWSF